MGNCLKCLSKNARELKEWCTEIVDDESVAARHEASKEEHEAKRGKIRKWLGKFDYLKEAWIFSRIPLVFLELAVGQFKTTGLLECWAMVPIFRGIGFAMSLVNSYITIYYALVCAYSLYYLFASLSTPLPWASCDKSWASDKCVDNYDPQVFSYTRCNNKTFQLRCENGQCYNKTATNGKVADCETNPDFLQELGWHDSEFPSHDYWNKVILNRSKNINESGSIVWQLLIATSVAWLIIFMLSIFGRRVSNRLIFFTALFSYFILLVLGIRGFLLPGAGAGILFYLTPEWDRMGDFHVWIDAATQIFFTLNFAYGGLISIAAYSNSFHTNIMRDAIIVSISNVLAEFIAGLVIFAYVGYLSYSTGEEIVVLIKAGQGLSFTIFPYAVASMPGSPFWSVLFFFMMFILGLDTMVRNIETTINSVYGLFPRLRRVRIERYLIITLCCLAYYLLDFPLMLQSGTFWIELMDNYTINWGIFIVGAIECISVVYFYGFENFRLDVGIMIGEKYTKSKWFYVWLPFWAFITPGCLIALTVLSFLEIQVLEIAEEDFPHWTSYIGEMLTASTIAGVLIWALFITIYFIYKRIPLKNLFKPDWKNWKPLREEHQELMNKAHGFTDTIHYHKRYHSRRKVEHVIVETRL